MTKGPYDRWSRVDELVGRIAELEGLLKAEQDSNHRLSAKELELEAENNRLLEKWIAEMADNQRLRSIVEHERNRQKPTGVIGAKKGISVYTTPEGFKPEKAQESKEGE